MEDGITTISVTLSLVVNADSDAWRRGKNPITILAELIADRIGICDSDADWSDLIDEWTVIAADGAVMA